MLTRYQMLLLLVLVLWPMAIFGLLFLMSRLERYVGRMEGRTPQEVGLEPIEGEAPEKEVRIVVGDKAL